MNSNPHSFESETESRLQCAVINDQAPLGAIGFSCSAAPPVARSPVRPFALLVILQTREIQRKHLSRLVSL
jgi:hypothetical protein